MDDSYPSTFMVPDDTPEIGDFLRCRMTDGGRDAFPVIDRRLRLHVTRCHELFCLVAGPDGKEWEVTFFTHHFR